MKKVLSIVASLLALVLVLTACSSKTSDKKEEKKVEIPKENRNNEEEYRRYIEKLKDPRYHTISDDLQ